MSTTRLLSLCRRGCAPDPVWLAGVWQEQLQSASRSWPAAGFATAQQAPSYDGNGAVGACQRQTSVGGALCQRRCMSGEAAGTAHSTSPPQGDSDDMESELKRRLLQQALKHVRTEGWTTRAIQAAARDLDFSPALAGVCKSEAELVEYFIRECNEALFQKIADERPLWASKSSTDKIKMAVRWRLEMLEPYVVSLMYELIDGIWASVGDQESDRSWYTKRLTLQVVYTATELYMLTDKSEGHADTWAALDRRMEDVDTFGSGVYTAEMKLMELFNRARTFGQ